MPKIAVITDTDSSLPPEIAAQNGIKQVPIRIHFEESTFTTGIDIDDRLLFEKIDQLKIIPSTSAPNPQDFILAFQAAFDEGYESIICICVSSQVSSTYGSAQAAAEHFPEREIHVIDSKTLCMAQAFITLSVAEKAAAGADIEEIKCTIQEMQGKIHTYAILPTLKYLALSGRVGKLAAGMADTLHIKPILSIKNGKLDMVDKIRTRRKAINCILRLLGQAADGKSIQRLAVIHVNNPEGAAEMEDLIRNNHETPENVITAEFTPGLSVHTGSGVVGFVVQTE